MNKNLSNFKDSLDYCWFDSNSDSIKTNRIPKLNEAFNLIACYTYYKENGLKNIINNDYLPNKNEIYYIYKDDEIGMLTEPYKYKFCGREYKIGHLNQIGPLICFRLRRNKFCIIWRDKNFASIPVYFNDYDKKFKEFLEEMKEYAGKFNLYPCITTDEALSLVERKKYNKIILISNVGNNNEGINFIEEARKIIGNDVIALFIGYFSQHANIIQKLKNALFSNEREFIKEYLKCFNDDYYGYERINKIENLKKIMEDHYKVQFTFDKKFLDFPYYKHDGKYSELSFKFNI
jgi:hypothetical protein